ncbi:hypothetical protein B0H14DRAFT_902755 [Mycena olivaceomarginata]|nr:hypothetical protein B0H14DRAFT_902755 [Mycena olivaceomarginata]
MPPPRPQVSSLPDANPRRRFCRCHPPRSALPLRVIWHGSHTDRASRCCASLPSFAAPSCSPVPRRQRCGVPSSSCIHHVRRATSPVPPYTASLPHATARRTCIYTHPALHRAILLQAATHDRHAPHISVIAPAVQTASPLCPVVVAPSPAPPGPSCAPLRFKFAPPCFTIWYPRHTYLSHHARNFPFMLFDTPNNIPLVLHSRETPIVARVTAFLQSLP